MDALPSDSGTLPSRLDMRLGMGLLLMDDLGAFCETCSIHLSEREVGISSSCAALKGERFVLCSRLAP